MSQKHNKKQRQIIRRAVDDIYGIRYQNIIDQYDGRIRLIWFIGAPLSMLFVGSILMNLYYYFGG